MTSTFIFERMKVWRDAKAVAVYIYELVSHFPPHERYCLSDQLRRAVISISSNIAEGSGRSTNKDKAHFFNIAYGSLLEVYSQLSVAEEIKYINHQQLAEARQQLEAIARQLSGLKKSLEN